MNKETIKELIGIKKFLFLKKVYFYILSIPFTHNLPLLAKIYKSDKWGSHYYAKHYQTHFKHLKFKRVKLFEIGVGGYHFPYIGGSSLRMWKRYFPFGKIFSLDIYDKKFVEEHRIKIFQGSQTDVHVLENIINVIGEPDIIIDDGSHINEHVITSFEYLFPKLKQNGIYVVEDVQTSYWPDYGGARDQNSTTIMNFFKGLVDGINHKEFIMENYTPSYYDLNIVSIAFYHNLIIIQKGKNTESSNLDLNNPESYQADKIYI